MVTDSKFDLDRILLVWDFKAEQAKADCLELLYQIYEPEDKTYTGLWQRFLTDLGRMFLNEFKEDAHSLRELLDATKELP